MTTRAPARQGAGRAPRYAGRHRQRNAGALPAVLRRRRSGHAAERADVGARAAAPRQRPPANAAATRPADAKRPGQHRPPRPRRRSARGAGGPATISLAGGTATIWADKDTNALVITAGRARMRALNAVIDKLDIRRPQVLVEAIIAEVTVDKTDDLGMNWARRRLGQQRRRRRLHLAGGRHLDHRSVRRHAVGGAQRTLEPATTRRHRTAQRPSVSAASRPPASTSPRCCARCRAMRAPTSSRTPSVVTRDNQEAKMEVAQEVPFLTGQYTHHQRHRQRLPDHSAGGCRHAS